LLLLVGSAATACGSSGGSTSAKGGTRTISLTITKNGCEPKDIETTAGPTTFEVENKGASEITEVEIMQGSSIKGEKEDITDGLSGSFTMTLEPGTYKISCPGGGAKDGTLKVTGSSAGTRPQSAAADEAVSTYRDYLERQTGLLVTNTKPLVDAVAAGDLAAAKTAYAKARPYYETVEPVAESFGDLDPEIDARDGDELPKGQTWGGFHRLEKALYHDGSLEGMAPVAQKLQTDVNELGEKVERVDLEPAAIANGAVELLNEVSKNKITGEEERYSHIDLVDFQGNVDGARAAFEAVRPLLATKDKAQAELIVGRFGDLDSALGAYKNGPGGYDFVLYTQLTPADTKTLSAAVDALAEPLSHVATQVVAP
jgi:iron uptake system component EfeO